MLQSFSNFYIPFFHPLPATTTATYSFATWDVLLPSEELAVKLAGSNVSTKLFWLLPEYKCTGRIKIIMCSVPVQLDGDVLAAYMSAYGSVEEVTVVRSADGTANDDFVLNICLNREGFQAIQHILTYRDRQTMVVVESRRLLCKQLGHLSRTCPQKSTINSNNIINNNSNIKNSNPGRNHLPNHHSFPGTRTTQTNRKKGGPR